MTTGLSAATSPVTAVSAQLTEAPNDDDRELSVWIEQYKVTVAGIAARVDLQQRNANVCAVILVGLVGFVFTYWTRNGYSAFVDKPILVLVVVAPIVALVFVWRHVDHDANVLDGGIYINTVLRPAVSRLVGADVLIWEDFLQTQRHQRVRWLGFIAVLGNEAVLLTSLLVPFLVYAWNLLLTRPGRAGGARQLFDGLLYLDTGTFLITLYGLFGTLFRFSRLTAQ